MALNSAVKVKRKAIARILIAVGELALENKDTIKIGLANQAGAARKPIQPSTKHPMPETVSFSNVGWFIDPYSKATRKRDVQNKTAAVILRLFFINFKMTLLL